MTNDKLPEVKAQKIKTILKRIITQATHQINTSGIDRTPSIIRIAKLGIELIDPNDKILDDER